ncbi:MAG: glycosyltransferase family 2 protein [Nitrospira sp.]|nr:glycosyltransferase family 2 protein [Nitrospira sp.]
MKLTLAICTHNHLPALRTTLASLHDLRLPRAPLDILVIDNASTDGTADWLVQTQWQRPDIPSHLTREPRLGVANARNRALIEAEGDYVIFLDDDETPDVDWLNHLEKVIEDYHPAAIGGRIRALLPGPRPAWLQDELLGFLGELDYGPAGCPLTETSTPIFTGNAAFHRQTVLDMGGFDGTLGRRGATQSGGEDTDLYRRLVGVGKLVRWAPDAVIWHRIEHWKLRRWYFLTLHYHQGHMEGSRQRGSASPGMPPKYVFAQLLRAYWRALRLRLAKGAAHSVRQEMNAAYFSGLVAGWRSRPK